MSWFDSSFSFARTALSQAQKSIDKVLDIGEEGGTTPDSAEPEPPSTSSAVKKSSNDKPKTSPTFSTSTPKLSSSRSTPTQASSPLRSTPVTASPSQDSFSSTWGGTWGGADSLWSSLTTPSTKKTEPASNQSEKKSTTPSAGQVERAGVSSAKKSRAARSKRREGSASKLESPPLPLSNPARSPVVEETKVSRDGSNVHSENSSMGPTPGSGTQPSSSLMTDAQSPTEKKAESAQSSLVGSMKPATPPGAENLLQTEASARCGSGGEGEKRVDSGDHRSTALAGTWGLLPSASGSVAVPVENRAGSPGGGETRETDRGGEGDVGWGNEIEVNLMVPLTETTDGTHEANTDTVNQVEEEKEKEKEQRPKSVSPLSNPSNMLGADSHHFRPGEEGWTEVVLSHSPETAENVPAADSSPIERTGTPLPATEEYRPSPPPITTPSPLLQPSPHSPLPISHSPPLPISPPPPTSQNGSTSPTPDPTSTPDLELAAETVSLPQHSLATSQLLTNDSEVAEKGEKVKEGDVPGEGSGSVLKTKESQEQESGEVRLVGKDGGQVEGGDSDSVGELGSSSGPEAMEAIQQELVRVKKLLEVRETKLVEMSRQMIELSETNQELQSQLSSAEQDLHTSQGGVDELRSEFTKRIGTTEKKLQTIIKERDSLKKQLQVLAAEQNQQRKSASQELSALLKEKEEQIAGLMEEGEKLSKKELQNSNIIKRLKEKNKQNDQLLTAQRQQIEDCEREISRLKDLVKKKEENEKKYQESLAQLNGIAEQQEKELTALKTERDELVDKARSLQTNLDNAYKELSELHKVTAVNKSAAHEAVLSAEQTARQELTEALEKQRVEHHREKEQLLLEVSELRASVSRCEQQSAWREERMKQEVSDVQQRLQEAEMRNQELTTTISQTTKPFLRQIETLRSAHSAQTANWEKVEADLTHRLVEAQTQLSAAVEKERSATEKALTLQSRITHLEKQTASLRQEKSRLSASLELEKAKAETLEESQQRESAKTEAVRSSMQQSLEDLRKEKEMLERQLEYERVRLEAESRKACLESQEKERLRSQLASSLSRGLSRQSSTASTTHTQSEILEKSLVQQISEDARGGSVSDSGTSFYHGRTPPTSASAIEQLQSLLKQKEGELANAQTLVSSLERSRAAMANDLAAVSAQNVDLTEKVEIIPHLKTQLQEIQKKNEALLQMYGEKAELAEELKLDIQDLKEMYRQQIDTLTKR